MYYLHNIYTRHIGTNVPSTNVNSKRHYSVMTRCPDPLCIVALVNPQQCLNCAQKRSEKEVELGKRWSINTYVWAYRYLCLRDGEKCSRCSAIPVTQYNSLLESPVTQYKLEIDHINGKNFDHEPSNLRLLCKKCNITVRNMRQSDSDQGEREKVRDYGKAQAQVMGRFREEGLSSTRLAREVIPYNTGDASMQANFLFEVDYRTWVLGNVREKGFIDKMDAINAGAEVVGCSPKTTAVYLSKLTSSYGPLTEIKDMLGKVVLSWKPEIDPAVNRDNGHKQS